MSNKRRRHFSPEFKAEAVKLVLDDERSISKVAGELGVAVSSLHEWVQQARVDRGSGKADQLTSSEKQELARLRRENRQLRMEREILKKATAFFAKENE